jgi:hypothetical protein
MSVCCIYAAVEQYTYNSPILNFSPFLENYTEFFLSKENSTVLFKKKKRTLLNLPAASIAMDKESSVWQFCQCEHVHYGMLLPIKTRQNSSDTLQ